MPSIFLSHSSKDKIFVHRLEKRLSKDGIRVWLDEADLKIGDSLAHRISEAIEQADFIGAIISLNSVTSSWVQKELSLAAAKEVTANKVVILPILIDYCDIPNFLRDKVYADFTDRKQFNRVYSKLLDTLGGKPSSYITRASARHYVPPYNIGTRDKSRMGLPPLVRGGGNSLVKRSRVKIYWHDTGLTKADALDLISLLDDIGAEGVMARHINPTTPDAIFINQDADQDLVRDVLSALPYDIKYIFPLDYPDHECGALSDFAISVGLHSTHREDSHPKTEEPKPLGENALTELFDKALTRKAFKIKLWELAGKK